MKFKYLIITFSIFIVLILLITALLPLFAADISNNNFIAGEIASIFRSFFLPVFIFTILILICLWAFFLYNYRLLLLLEREDWPAIAYYLEQKIFIKGKYNNRYVRLLASSYLVISDYPSVSALESKASLAKPSTVSSNVLIFGSARILTGKYPDSALFFKTQLNKGKLNKKDKEWVRWFFGFSHLLNSSFNLVEPEFAALAESSPDAYITGLSAYFLSNNLAKHSQYPQVCNAAAENGRKRVVKALKTIGAWEKEGKKMASDIHITIIRKYIDEAGKWLFELRA